MNMLESSTNIVLTQKCKVNTKNMTL